MKNFILRKVLLIISLLIVSLLIVSCGKTKTEETSSKDAEVTKVDSLGYKVISEEIQDLKVENAVPKSKYAIDVSKIEGDKLSVTIQSNIINAKDAYEVALFLKNQTQELNKDKLEKEGVKNIEVTIKGDNKSWLYEKDGYIKEISFK